ncbi:MAG: CBS domain-containing protein [Rhodobacteraceae bacterium HLUCCA08]|nr:MAG: CBS domain-containing protein [Rhodobacteraceae bacterium HLUCCA08]
MPLTSTELTRFLDAVHPYDALEGDMLPTLVPRIDQLELVADDPVYDLGEALEGLYIVHHGEVEVTDDTGETVSILGPRNSFGERGLLRDGRAVTAARALTDTLLLRLPAETFHRLMKQAPQFARFYDRRRPKARVRANDLATTRVDGFMSRGLVTCPPNASVQEAAVIMRTRRTSSVCVTDGGALVGILTTRDLAGKVVATGLSLSTPVAQIMAEAPLTLPPSAIGSDVLHLMMERRIGHVPITDGDRLVGIVTQTDLTRFQAVSSAELVSRLAGAANAAEMARVTAEIPNLLMQLLAAGNRHEVVTRLITDIADTATRRLLALAEAQLGQPPVPYLWLACGSQGRQEQTGVSDQDNCLILSDDFTEDMRPYFEQLAKFVSDGLDTCGYFYCPGDMMATNPRWCQPLATWRRYFDGWIAAPDTEAQMLASVMFDLRPIGGDRTLFDGLQQATLDKAAKNSIFVAHMIGNSLKHAPPLGLLRGLATIRSGEHRNQLDLKLNGVVPVVDLGRIYALRGKLSVANTRARIEAAITAGVVSRSGGRDLLDAYDLIATTRLDHQAAQVNAGEKPGNFLSPANLSDFERSHLRDAFVVVKTLQSAAGQGKGIIG